MRGIAAVHRIDDLDLDHDRLADRRRRRREHQLEAVSADRCVLTEGRPLEHVLGVVVGQRPVARDRRAVERVDAAGDRQRIVEPQDLVAVHDRQGGPGLGRIGIVDHLDHARAHAPRVERRLPRVPRDHVGTGRQPRGVPHHRLARLRKRDQAPLVVPRDPGEALLPRRVLLEDVLRRDAARVDEPRRRRGLDVRRRQPHGQRLLRAVPLTKADELVAPTVVDLVDRVLGPQILVGDRVVEGQRRIDRAVDDRHARRHRLPLHRRAWVRAVARPRRADRHENGQHQRGPGEDEAGRSRRSRRSRRSGHHRKSTSGLPAA